MPRVNTLVPFILTAVTHTLIMHCSEGTHSKSQEEHGSTLVESVQHSQPEPPASVDSGAAALRVVALLPQQCVRPQVLVGHTHHHDGQGSVDQVEDGEVDAVDGVGARPGVEQLPPEQQHCIRLSQHTQRREGACAYACHNTHTEERGSMCIG